MKKPEMLYTVTVGQTREKYRENEKALDNILNRSSVPDVRNMLNDQPTVYEPEKIVEKLSNSFRVVQTDEDLEWNRAIDRAISIVKGGGVNE